MNKSTTEDEKSRSIETFCVSHSGALNGEIDMPGDKSISHRALMLGAIAHGVTHISGLLEGEDCLSTARALRALGVQIDIKDDDDGRQWVVHGAGSAGLKASHEPLDLGNSGTGMRLMAGLLAGQQVASTLIGDESLMSRPMERIAKPLRAMGANVATDNGKPPMTISVGAALKGTHYESKVASAQVKSAVLLAGLGGQGITSVTEPVRSRDHTERMLTAFGCPVHVDDLSVSLQGGAQLSAIDVDVPGDISSAAFFMVAASVIPGSLLTLRNVGINPTRIGVLQILQAMGANIERVNVRSMHGEPVCDLRVTAAELHGIDVPPEWVPSAIDEFPVIFVAAALASGTTRVTGAEELKVKESNRLGAMAEGLRTLGVKLVETDDGMEIIGGSGLSGGEINSYGDHRIAMAFAVAGCCAKEPIIVKDVANVATSFPNFAQFAVQVGMVLDASDVGQNHPGQPKCNNAGSPEQS